MSVALPIVSEPLTVLEAPVAVELTLAQSRVDASLGRRMAALGLRTGTPVTVLQKTAGGGRLLAVAGARIAVDREVAAHLQVTPVAAGQPDSRPGRA